MYNNSDTRNEFCVRPFYRGSPSYPSLWVIELLRIVAPDRLGHLPSPSGGLRFLTLPRVPQRSRQSFALLLKSWMALVRELQHRDIDWFGELGECQQHPDGAWRVNSSKSIPKSSRNSAAAALFSRLVTAIPAPHALPVPASFPLRNLLSVHHAT